MINVLAMSCTLIVQQCTIPHMRDFAWQNTVHSTAEQFPPLWFKELFRFRHHEFRQLMVGFGLVNAMGLPFDIKVGTEGNDPTKKSWISTETCLLVLLRRLASPACLSDLTEVLGVLRSLCSKAVSHMLHYLYTDFVEPINQLERWTGFFAEWAAVFAEADCPVEGVIGVIDGHFVAACRPGGDGCVAPNYHDYQVYNGHDRMHGLKFLSIVFPCGLTLHKGPWTGNQHDSGALSRTNVSNLHLLLLFVLCFLTLCFCRFLT